MRPYLRPAAAALLAAGALAAVPVGPAGADTPDGPSGPVIVHDGVWLLRTTPTGGGAQQSFTYGRGSDIPLVGDWDGDGTETPGVVRPNADFTQYQWFLRNSAGAGPADVTFTFGEIRFVPVDRLGSIPVAGNFDPSDDAYEVGVVLSPYSYDGTLNWQVSRNLATGGPVTSFAYGRSGDRPVVGDWDGNGTDTAGIWRYPNLWFLNNRQLAGGGAQLAFGFGSSDPQLPVVGDWDGNGTDTPGVLRNIPASRADGPYQQWFYRNSNGPGAASGSFVFGGAAQTLGLPIEAIPRLTIEVS